MSGRKEFFEPNLYLYDAYPGGIGFSEPLFRVHGILVRKTRELIRACPATRGVLRAWGQREIWCRGRRRRRWRFWIGCAYKKLTWDELETSAADKFSRLAALKPVRATPAASAGVAAAEETDPISLLLGGGIARNQYGEHLAIRNWFSTPEFVRSLRRLRWNC